MTPDELAHVVMVRADELGTISEEADRLTRRFATPAMRQAHDLADRWMRDAGMTVREDSVGNLIGRYEADKPGARTLLLGSHLDTVRDAGKYDGPLGVLVALAAVKRLALAKRRLPIALEVICFADEEGLRYGTAYLGSKAFAGSFDPQYLDRLDGDGVSMCEAIGLYGGDSDGIRGDRRRNDDLIGYYEVHIEQGPVLEAEGLPVGVVSAIAGQSRLSLRFIGVAGHAGTVPMLMRCDALAGAAEFILAAEELARAQEGIVATVGRIAVEPDASNVIPGAARISLDVRHQEDALRQQARTQLRDLASDICVRRGLTLDWQVVQESASVPCDPRLAGLLAGAVQQLGLPARRLPSGAGHDAVPMAGLTPVAMLFVRCKAGISHNPAEQVAEADVAVAISVLDRAIELLASSEGPI